MSVSISVIKMGARTHPSAQNRDSLPHILVQSFGASLGVGVVEVSIGVAEANVASVATKMSNFMMMEILCKSVA